MKRYLCAIIVILAFCVFPVTNLEAASEKIGVLDLQRCQKIY